MPDLLGVVGYVKPGTATTPPAAAAAPGGSAVVPRATSPGALTAAGGPPAGTLSRYNSLEPSCLIDPNAPAKPTTPQTVAVARPMEKPQTSATKVQQTSGTKVQPHLLNKPGEPAFQLQLTPEVAVFTTTPSKVPVCANLSFKNTTNVKQGFKVRCTSTEIFRVQPPMGFIDAGQTQNIRIWYHSKQPNASNMKHYFVFCHKKAVTGRSLEDMWAKNARPDGVRRIAAEFKEQQ